MSRSHVTVDLEYLNSLEADACAYHEMKLFGYWDTEYKIHYTAEIGQGLMELGERFNLIPLYTKYER